MKLLTRMQRGGAFAAIVVAAPAAIYAANAPVGAVPGTSAPYADGAVRAAQLAATTGQPDAGAESYTKHCAICHGDYRQGILPGFPPLADIKRQMPDKQITQLVREGKGRMPAFKMISDDELANLLKYLGTTPAEAPPPPEPTGRTRQGIQLTGEAAAGESLFQQNCAFCHGRDAMGGETGPDLTASKLVLSDKDGSKIAAVVRDGRIVADKRMPAFQFSKPELDILVAFIRVRIVAVATMEGGPPGVAVADLQTGNAEAGKQYFNGAGGCVKCHSPNGDLAGIARRLEGLELEESMLYPFNAKSTVVVTLRSGEKVSGTVAYQDEFTIGIHDSTDTYRSWAVEDVKFTVDSPVEAHVDQFPKYTDDDIHNLMAYLQTLR